MERNLPEYYFYRRGIAIDLLAITLLWCLGVILINPSGDFPLNDDWSYGIAVKNLVENKVYQPTNWTSMTLISQVAWGALFSFIFGFSFETLRFSTLLLSLAGLLAFYLSIRQLDQPRSLAVLVTLVVAFNPLYFALSHTFMTDVPFIAFTILALLFLIRYLNTDTGSALAWGAVFSILAILCRQTGLFIPIAFGLTYISKWGFHRKHIMRGLLPLLLGVGSLYIFQYWMNSTGATPALYGKQVHQLLKAVQTPGQWLNRLTFNSFLSILYPGLFLIPVLMVVFFSKAKTAQATKAQKWVKWGIVPISLFIGLSLFYKEELMPIGKNMLLNAGIGPLSLYDTYTLQLPSIPGFAKEFWLAVTIISVIGGAVLLIYLFAALNFAARHLGQRGMNNRSYITLFLLTGAAVYTLPLLLLPTYFDRYTLVLVVLCILIILSFIDRINLGSPKLLLAGTGLLTGFSFFSLALTHDYLAWNRARWKALEHLSESRNIPYTDIHGGFEFNGLMRYSNNTKAANLQNNWQPKDEDINQYKYILTFGELEGHEVIASYHYSRWLPPHHHKVLVLMRKEAIAQKTNHAE